MNRRKKHFRIMAVALCLALVVGFGASYQARAESTPDFPVVSNEQELLEAFEVAQDGGKIGISGTIVLSDGVTIGSNDKRITIVRMDEGAHFTVQGENLIQNISFDGANIRSSMGIFFLFTGNTEFTNYSFANCDCSDGMGAAITGDHAGAIINNCIFKNNTAYNGSHISMSGTAHYEINDCIFQYGVAPFFGGAISIMGGTDVLEINRCTITDNSAGRLGGGIYNAGTCVITETKLFNNTADEFGDDYASENNEFTISESIEELIPLYASIRLKPIEWETTQYSIYNGGKLILEEIPEEPDKPTEPENPEEPENPDNPEQPENPENPDEPTNPEQPEQPDEPESPGDGTEEPDEPGTPDNSEEQPTEIPSDGGQEESPDQGQGGGSENPPSTDGGDTSTNTDNSSTTTDNSTTNTTTSSSTNTSTSSTDSSDRSTTTDNSRNETDNSRQITTTDSNNTSTVNYYYTGDGQPSGNPNGVQTIVIPAGTSGSGEPINQTIRVESSQPEGGIAGGGGDITLNVNVNIGEQTAQQSQMQELQAQPMIQQGAASPDSASGFSLYQVLVLCLLSAVLVCLIKRR